VRQGAGKTPRLRYLYSTREEPLPSEHGTHSKVKARFWRWLEPFAGERPQNAGNRWLLAREGSVIREELLAGWVPKWLSPRPHANLRPQASLDSLRCFVFARLRPTPNRGWCTLQEIIDVAHQSVSIDSQTPLAFAPGEGFGFVGGGVRV